MKSRRLLICQNPLYGGFGFCINISMETKFITKNSMGWLQVINYECKTCGKQYLLQTEAEACFDKHKEKK